MFMKGKNRIGIEPGPVIFFPLDFTAFIICWQAQTVPFMTMLWLPPSLHASRIAGFVHTAI
jgi:hypothetical protein